MSERVMKMDRNNQKHPHPRAPCAVPGAKSQRKTLCRNRPADPAHRRHRSRAPVPGDSEYLLARNALNDLRNQRIANGGYTDAADAALANLLRAKVPFHLFGHTR